MPPNKKRRAGGGRPPRGCQSAALVVNKHWRVRSKPEVFQNLSDPLKISPSGLAHSARPAQIDHPADFCDFHFARHSPTEMQKNCAGRTSLRICIKNASGNMHFCLHVCLLHYFSRFSKMCSPPSVGSTFLKNDSKQSAFKNVSFDSLLGALAHSVPLHRTLFRQ